MRIQVGHVILAFDGTIRSAKHKRFLCVCAAEGLFFRINSKPYFRPHMPISKGDNPECLEYDSYVELRGVIEMGIGDLEQSLAAGDARILGSIGSATALELRRQTLAARTLTGQQKDVIAANLSVILGQADGGST